ncbi:MAG: hypothetical protein MJ078_01115 [Clostridia bacterium]|nr:hypothetical protein [Clostridia bacterium]
MGVTGDEQVKGDTFIAAYSASGTDFYDLIDGAALDLKEKLGTFSLRTEKDKPAFMPYFGWCTWDSFYEKVTAEDVKNGLENFREGGFVPRFVLLDDGWQTTSDNHLDRGFWKLSDFKANEKFGNALAPTVSMAKQQYGVRYFYVWHAVMGYWGGIDCQSPAMKPYLPLPAASRYEDTLRGQDPAYYDRQAAPFGIADKEKIGAFYDGYHAYLEKEGVDGVKIDVQSQLEGYGNVSGGRTALVKAVREGMEASVRKHFHGGLINCMSCNNDTLFHLRDSNLTRSSDDFLPGVAESHATHIYTNAVNSVFMRPFTYCDWDMFQTAHPMGEYHAAARAVSGSPVYVSDKVGEHDFRVIRDLTDEEGRLFLAEDIARPLPKCLFSDFLSGKTVLSLFSRNPNGYAVGLFSPRLEEGKQMAETFSPGDIPHLTAQTCAVYSRRSGESRLMNSRDVLPLTLPGLSFDLITLSPLQNGFALLGVTEKYNVGGTVTKAETKNGVIFFTARTPGTLLFYSEKSVGQVLLNGKPLSFTEREGFYRVSLPMAGEISLS